MDGHTIAVLVLWSYTARGGGGGGGGVGVCVLHCLHIYAKLFTVNRLFIGDNLFGKIGKYEKFTNIS